MREAHFQTQLMEGHKGVTAVLVPFDPGVQWGPPVRLAGRRHGWLVKGTANGAKFSGYVGERWGRFFITLDDALRESAEVAVGDVVSMTIQPTRSPTAYHLAYESSKVTTQPTQARADAIAWPEGPAPARAKAPKRARGSGSSAKRPKRHGRPRGRPA